jgi:hypothetical protein
METTMDTPTKKVKLDLTRCDGNAFALIAAFRGQARREGWSGDEIEAVSKQAMSGDYDHLLQTLIGFC